MKQYDLIVIGGGPAGMQAALTAARRGHQVILLEREGELGGQLICSEYDEVKQDLTGADGRIPSVSPWRLRTFDSGISKINYYKVLENRKKFLCKRM